MHTSRLRPIPDFGGIDMSKASNGDATDAKADVVATGWSPEGEVSIRAQDF